MDVIALHQAGVEQAVASSGTAITETQLQILSKYTPNFLLAFDNDEAGRTTTKKVIEMLLRLDLNTKVVDFGRYKDAGEMFEDNPKAWAEAAKIAAEGLEWWIGEEIKTAGEMKYIENKKKVVKAMLPILGLVTDPTRLDHYAQRLALLIGAKTESVYEALEKVVKPEGKSNTATPANAALTNEEQLLAVALSRPDLIGLYSEKLNDVIWQSEDASRIADEVKKAYSDKTLVKNQSQFLSAVKTNLDSRVSEKIDSWQFWLSNQWGDLSDELARELAEEKLGQITTKDYERRKEALALDIRRAQEKGDLNEVKQLMKELSELAKERGS
jgi:DNA primase